MNNKPLSRLLPCALAALLCAACDTRPECVMEEDDFAAVIMDIYRLEGMQRFSYLEDSVRMEDYYSVLLTRHGINRAKLDTTVAWYLARPEDYLRVCDSIEARLLRQNDSIRKEMDSQSAVNERDGGIQRKLRQRRQPR